MGNAHADLTPPHTRGQPPPTGAAGPEAYAGVRLEAMPGLGGRIVAGGGGRHRGSSAASGAGAARPQTVVQKTKLVKNACHLHKDSVRLARTAPLDGARYQLQFHFDAEAPCRITVYYLADETKDPDTGRLLHRPLFAPEDDWVVGPHPFGAGTNQTYSTAALGYEGADLASKVGTAGGVEGPCHIYIVIRPDDAGTDEASSGRQGQDVTSQITVLSVEPGRSSSSEGAAASASTAAAAPLTARVLKQKLETPHGIFVLREIYGVAGVAAAAAAAAAAAGSGAEAAGQADEAGTDGSAADCVVCLTNKRELAILPCRHMCVCRFCAAECIRSQDSKCPICRNPAQALLKLTCDDEEGAPAVEAGAAPAETTG